MVNQTSRIFQIITEMSAMFAEHFAEFYDLFNNDKNYKKEIQFVNRWAGRPKTILDIGCGTAQYWRFFHPKQTITGIEQSPMMSGKSIYNRQIQNANIQRVSFGKRYKCDCVTALFDVVNYIPNQDWWNKLPLKKGGFFIFDIYDKEKVDRDGFKTTIKNRGNMERYVRPMGYEKGIAKLRIYMTGYSFREFFEYEDHKLFIWSEKDIRKFARKNFEIVEIKKTKRWQTWFKLRKK
jgi:predicted TPR repeat methyltransferase